MANNSTSRIAINLAFSADTSKAKLQLNELQTSLNKLLTSYGQKEGFGLTKDLQEATMAAAKLKVQLSNATNAKTGNLDLTKFRDSLNQAGMTLGKYQKQLANLGPEGDAVFASLARSITMAEIPLRRSNTLLNNFAVTLKNTVKWQISSSMVHGFVGAMQSAYGYAQDLNESLNNIRIVTGQSTEQMAKFAVEANKAAKELSTTTTAYTDAALIFYQQGLSDEEAKRRTDVTIKMANVTKDSAKEVSSYMTAIWNNFAKGSDNLEHYADVITALGAATASSSAEIAGGLEKFAAVGETIGLSYEYAATSLATIVATTRQSEDTVGTALKTIFSRIQGLKLGETLDDGTELNKYSNALFAVGVNIKDVNGEIKNMDTILDELGSKWQSLSKDQQMALAQTVAGTRQYTQLIALMDNWGTFQKNLATAQSSQGTLSKQAEIYADSWEASKKRVKAAAQEIYSALLDEDFFIELNKGAEKTLGVFKKLIDSAGGLKGVLFMVGTAMMNAFGPQISQSINNVLSGIQNSSKFGYDLNKDFKKQANNKLANMYTNSASDSGQAAGFAYEQQAKAQNNLIDIAERLTQEEIQQYQTLLDIQDVQVKNTIEAGQQLEAEKAKLIELENNFEIKGDASLEDLAEFERIKNNLIDLNAQYARMGHVAKDIKAVSTSTKDASQKTAEYKKIVASIKDQLAEIEKGMSDAFGKEVAAALEELENGSINGEKALERLQIAIRKTGQTINENNQELQTTGLKIADNEDLAVESLKKMPEACKSVGTAVADVDVKERTLVNTTKMMREEFNKATPKVYTFGDGVQAVGSIMSSAAAAYRSFKNIGSIWDNEDLSTGEKVFETLSAITMGTMALLPLLKAENWEKTKGLLLNKERIATTLGVIGLLKKEQAETIRNTILKKGEITVSLILKAINWELVAVAALVAAFAGIYVALKASANEAEEEIRRANQAAADAKKAAEEAKSAYDNLVNGFNEYDEAINKLDELIEGTVEYADALREANQQAMELIKTNSNLSYTKENGRIIFTNKDEAIAASRSKMYMADAGAYAADLGANQLEKNKLLTNAVSGGVQDNLSAIFDSPVQDPNSWQYESIDFSQQQLLLNTENLDILLKAISENGGIYESSLLNNIEGLDTTDQILIRTLEEHAGYLEELAKSTNELDNTNKLLKDQVFNSTLMADDTYASMSQSEQDAILKLMENSISEEEIANIINTYRENWEDSGEYSDAEAQSKYAELMGYKKYENLNGNKGKYLKVDGTWTEEIDDSYVRNYVANHEAQIEIQRKIQDRQNSNVNKISNLSSSLNKQFGDASGNLMSILSTGKGNLSNLSVDTVQALKKNLNKNGKNLIKDAFGSLTDEEWKSLGFSNADSYIKALEDSINEYNIDGKLIEESNKKIAEKQTFLEAMDSARESIDKGESINDDLRETISTDPEFWKNFDKLNQIEQIEKLNSLQSEYNKKLWEENDAQIALKKSYDEKNLRDNLDKLKKEIANKEKDIEDYTKQLSSPDVIDSDRANTSKMLGEAKKELAELKKETKDYEQQLENFENIKIIDPNDLIPDILDDKVDQIISYTEKIKSAAEMIGEGWKVAKEDVEDFCDMYPTLAAQAKVLADGSLELTQEQVEAVLNGDKVKIQADTEVMDHQLEQQILVLEAEIELNKEKMQIMSDFLDGKKTESEAESALAKTQNEYEAKLEALVGEEAVNAAKEAAGANGETTKVTLDNLNKIGRSAKKVGDAIRKALAGEVVDWTDSETGGNVGNFSEYYKSLRGDKKLITLEDYQGNDGDKYLYYEQLIQDLDAQNAEDAKKIAFLKNQQSKLRNANNSIIDSLNGMGKNANSNSDKAKSKNLNDEIDRYHVIKNQLEDIEAQLDRISKAKERAFGAEKLNLIQQEIDAQKQLLAGNEEYLRQVSGNLGNERNALSAYGAQFDANGTITNYNALIAAQVSSYNAMGGSEEAEEAYNKFKDLLSKYEEDQDSFKELQQSIIDKKNEIYDLMLEKTQYSVEWKINIEDRELTYLEYLLERIENRAFSAAEAIANIGLQTEHLFNKSGANKSGILGLLQNHGYSAQDAQGILSQMESGTFDTNALKDTLRLTQGELDALDGWVDDLMSINQQLYEMRDKVWEGLNKEFEEYNTKMEDGISKMEHLKSITQNYQNIIGIVGKKTLGVTNNFINYLNNTISQQSRNILAGNKAELDAIKKAREDIAATFDENWTDEDKKKWQEQMDTIENKYREVESSFMSSWEEALQSAADAWKASVDNIIEDFSKKLAGTAGSLAHLREQYDRTVEIDDRYLDDYEKIYHLTKLTREVGKAIDSTDNLNAKKELRELQEEILEMQKEGKEISQYDLDYETKKFELKQAQLALNEAQNAKSNVTMVRGDDGTYGYVYTADANAVENAEQNYEDKLYEMQKLNGDYIKSLQDNIIKAEEECMNAIQELNVADFANYEEYQARVDEITAYYQGKMGYYSSEMDKVLDNNRKLYIEDWQAYHDATGYKISEDQNYIDSFNETALSTLTGFQTMEEYQRAFNQTIGSPNDPNSLLGQLANNYNEWKDSVDLAMKAAGTSTENFSNKLDTEVNGQDGIKNNSEEAMRSVEEMAKNMQTTFAETINTVGRWASDYGTKIGEMISANDKLISSYNALRTAMGLKVTSSNTSSAQNIPSTPSNPGPANPNPEDSGNRGGASANGGKFISEPAHYDADGKTDANHPPAATNGIFYLVDTAPDKNYPYGIAKKPGARRYGWVSAFKTGGYTGDWTGEGKLALLHQKEMVLNSEDTSNMLSIVDMVRQIAKVIDLNAAAASGIYSSMSSAYRVAGNNGAVQQEVTVYADFPGITSADGLEDAFKNIASDALHYINRNF